MKIKIIKPNVILLSFPNRKELTFTMCRVEEFYEAASDKLRGNKFTWAEFIDEFTNEEGHMDYFHSWSGFNVPGESFYWWAVNFDDHSSRERAMIDLVYENINIDEKFYVIAAQETDSMIEDHEIAHATWYTTNDYRAKMQSLNSKLDANVRKQLIEGFTQLGYSATVHEDELQAFLSTSDATYLQNRFGISEEDFNTVTPAYMKVFEEYCK